MARRIPPALMAQHLLAAQVARYVATSGYANSYNIHLCTTAAGAVGEGVWNEFYSSYVLGTPTPISPETGESSGVTLAITGRDLYSNSVPAGIAGANLHGYPQGAYTGYWRADDQAGMTYTFAGLPANKPVRATTCSVISTGSGGTWELAVGGGAPVPGTSHNVAEGGPYVYSALGDTDGSGGLVVTMTEIVANKLYPCFLVLEF